MNAPATDAELSTLVAQARRCVPHVSADFATRLTGKTTTEAKSALFAEMVGEGSLVAQARMRSELERAGLTVDAIARSAVAGAAAENMRRQLLTSGIGVAGQGNGEPITAAESMRRQLLRTGDANDGK